MVNFCLAIFILKMEENMQHFWHIMLYYFKKFSKWSTKMICAVCGEGPVTDQMCQKCLWGCVLQISHWTMLHSQVRPFEVDSYQIETLIKNNQHYTMW